MNLKAVDKQLGEVAEAFEDLGDELEDVGDAVEDLDKKDGMDHLGDELDDVGHAAEEVAEELGELGEEFIKSVKTAKYVDEHYGEEPIGDHAGPHVRNMYFF